MTKKDKEKIDHESRFTSENREPKELVSLGGTAVTSSGKLTRSNFFRFIGHNLDDYDDIQLSPQDARKIHTHLQKLSTGSTAMVPMYCGGPKCPFKDRCPLFAIKKHPLGKQCLIEVQLMKEWIVRYFEEYGVDPNNFTEVAYISELAEIEIHLMRLNMNLARAENSELIVDKIVGVSNDGTPLVQKDVSPFMEMKDRLQARRSRIIKLMVGDRQEKYKKEAALRMKLEQDPSSKMSNMRAKLDDLTRQLENVAKEIPSENIGPRSAQDVIDAEFEEGDND